MGKQLKTASQIANQRTRFGYNSIEDTSRRRVPMTKPASEALFLTPQKRNRATATARDDRRNFTILAWMVRRHLDNVSRFTPHFRLRSKTKEARDVDAIVQKLMRWHAGRRQFDALGRHGRDETMRMFEACKVLSGDCGLLKVKGWKLQGIEGDRIAKVATTEAQLPAAQLKKVRDCGIEFDESEQRKRFMLCKRTGEKGDGLAFERMVPANEIIFDGYWPERFDSDRGVSPLLTALNEGADVRETWEWLVLKAKASALFGLAFTRKGSDEMLPTQGEAIEEDGAPQNEDGGYARQVSESVKARGLINLDLDEGDDVKEIQSNTPNPNVIGFTRELIRSVLLALDIPFTFYDSLTASFSARIADRNEYEECCEWKRDKNADVLDEVYGQWLFPLWAASDWFGFGKALKAAGISVEEAAATLQWVPAGRPWLDRTNEMSGAILQLAAGATSSPRLCSAYGDDAYALADEQAEYLEYCKSIGLPLLYADSGKAAVQSIMTQAVSGAQNKPENTPPQDVQKGDPNE